MIYSYPGANTTGPYPELYRYDCGFEWCYYYSQFQVRFNKFMDLTSVRRAVRLGSPDGNILADTNFIISVGGDVFILNPVDSNGYRGNFRFKVGASYSIVVDSTARDVNGNALVPSFTATFVPEPYFRVRESNPGNGSIDVSVGSGIQLIFNSKIDTSMLSHITISPAVVGNWWIGYDSATVVLNPVAPLTPSTAYTVMVDGSAEDADGNRIVGPFAAGFRTVDFRLSSSSPSPGAGNIGLSSGVYSWFTLPLDTATMRSAFHLTPATPLVFSNIYYGTTGYNVVPTDGLLSSTMYTVRIDTTLRSLAGDRLAAQAEYSFTTAPFGVVSTSPVNDQVGWSRESYIYIRTNAPLDAATVSGSILISPPATLSFSYCDGCSDFQFYPPGGLSALTEYTVTVGTSLKTRRGESLPAPYSFSFTTGPD